MRRRAGPSLDYKASLLIRYEANKKSSTMAAAVASAPDADHTGYLNTREIKNENFKTLLSLVSRPRS